MTGSGKQADPKDFPHNPRAINRDVRQVDEESKK
jgi:hypothetical protein